jgi:hypothetical protein
MFNTLELKLKYRGNFNIVNQQRQRSSTTNWVL